MNKKEKIILFISLALVSLSLLFLFMPIFKIRIYSVYLWDLSRTEIDNYSLTIFDVIFGNYYFKAKPLCVLFLIVPILNIISLLLSFKYKNYSKYFFLVSMVVAISTVILISYSNSYYAKTIGCKTYMYQEDLLKVSNEITPLVPESTSHKISYWIDLGIGSYLCIICNSLSAFIIFVERFLFFEKMK